MFKISSFQILLCLAFVGVSSSLFVACSPSSSADALPSSSFGLLQDQILTPSCATSGCHASEKDASFNQHGLVLEKSVAYKNLLNVIATNVNAQKDNVMRVKPNKSDESLLLHKVILESGHHSGKNYGNPMPLGGNPLSYGQIEFIRRWIDAGAPESGTVADEKLLADNNPQANSFEPPAPPPAGKGLQVAISRFDVAPNFERELFVYKKLNNPEPMYVKRIEIKMRNNSHHLVVYDFVPTTPQSAIPQYDVIRDLRDKNGILNFQTVVSMGYHVFAAAAQQPLFNYEFPEGTALYFPANHSLDLNAHYVNKTLQTQYGEAYINFYTVPASEVKQVVKTFNLGNTNITLPPKQRTTLTRNFSMTKTTNVIALVSHMHKLGEKFVVKLSKNGQVVYSTNDWEHPLTSNYTPPLVLQRGEGITSEITYNNTTDKTVRFGFTSEDEMGIIFGYYYEQ